MYQYQKKRSVLTRQNVLIAESLVSMPKFFLCEITQVMKRVAEMITEV